MITATDDSRPTDPTKLPTSLTHEASSAHSRINIPLNIENWKGIPEDQQKDLMWFHQHALDNKMSSEECAEALGYDWSTLFKVLKGIYEGSYLKVCQSIRQYKKVMDERASITQNEFAENGISRLIFAGLDYAAANNSMTMISGESRMGKSVSASVWRARNNHGRSVMIEIPVIGGTKGILREIASGVGVGKNLPTTQTFEALCRAFNRNRILILDEAQRLLPADNRSNPEKLEVIRSLHDRTGMAVAFLCTDRFSRELTRLDYQYEQVLGRIGMPIKLPKHIPWADILPIVSQYIANPGEDLKKACMQAANERGRLGIMVETLKIASRMASKAKKRLDDDTVLRAFALRHQMSGI